MRRQAFHSERACDAHAVGVLIRPVVEQFHVGALGDGGVDLLLPSDAGFPPGIVNSGDIIRP